MENYCFDVPKILAGQWKIIGGPSTPVNPFCRRSRHSSHPRVITWPFIHSITARNDRWLRLNRCNSHHDESTFWRCRRRRAKIPTLVGDGLPQRSTGFAQFSVSCQSAIPLTTDPRSGSCRQGFLQCRIYKCRGSVRHIYAIKHLLTYLLIYFLYLRQGPLHTQFYFTTECGYSKNVVSKLN